jgi:hypothetical protein
MTEVPERGRALALHVRFPAAPFRCAGRELGQHGVRAVFVCDCLLQEVISEAHDIGQKARRHAHEGRHIGRGIRSSSTMIVIRMAMTPSLNAARRSFPIIRLCSPG